MRNRYIRFAILVSAVAIGMGVGWLLFHSKTPGVVQKTPIQNASTPTEPNNVVQYVNSTYGFAWAYPNAVSFNEDYQGSCFVVDSHDSDGTPVGHDEAVNFSKGDSIPIIFIPESPQDSSIFAAGVGYRFTPNCSEPLMSLQVINENSNFNLAAYLQEQVASGNEPQNQGASGLTVSQVSLMVNGQIVPVIRSVDGSVMANTTDTYYFDHGMHLYLLSYEYSQGQLDPEGQGSPHYSTLYPDAFPDYQLANQIIQGFRFTK